MKLRTTFTERKAIGGRLDDFEHDALSAHALMQAVDTVRGYYPESVFPENGESLDSKSASMARHTCDNIKRLADELMREWGYE